jgi:hypothetical protein
MKSKIVIMALVLGIMMSCGGGSIGNHKISDLKSKGLTDEQIKTLKDEAKKLKIEWEGKSKAMGGTVTKDYLNLALTEALENDIEAMVEENARIARDKVRLEKVKLTVDSVLNFKSKEINDNFKKLPELFEKYSIKYPNITFNFMLAQSKYMSREASEDFLINFNYGALNEGNFESKISKGEDEYGYYTYASFEDFIKDYAQYQAKLKSEGCLDDEGSYLFYMFRSHIIEVVKFTYENTYFGKVTVEMLKPDLTIADLNSLKKYEFTRYTYKLSDADLKKLNSQIWEVNFPVIMLKELLYTGTLSSRNDIYDYTHFHTVLDVGEMKTLKLKALLSIRDYNNALGRGVGYAVEDIISEIKRYQSEVGIDNTLTVDQYYEILEKIYGKKYSDGVRNIVFPFDQFVKFYQSR